jgi:alcohol oxidase
VPETLILSSSNSSDSENKATSIRARKLVVISAGALSSPLILQRSGIGSSTRLAEIGIPVISDLPGVGENYQDHQLVMSAISRVESGPDDTGDGIISSNPDILSRLAEEYNSGKGALAWNFADAGGKLRPTLKELREMDSFEFEKKWIEVFIDKPEKPVIFVVLLAL